MRKFVIITREDKIEICNKDEIDDMKLSKIPFVVLGYICDSQKFGDRCSTLCYAYRKGVCRARIIKDHDGNLWHLILRL